MEVAVPVDEVMSAPQFGCMPDADQDAMGDAYLQVFALAHSAFVTQLSIAAAMYNERVLQYPNCQDSGHRSNTAEFFTRWCNMSHHDANEHVRMAVALQDLPFTLDALAEGKINQQQLKYLTQFLTPETEEKYLDNFVFKTIASIKRDAREAQLAANPPKDDVPIDRGVRWWKRRFAQGWRIAADLSEVEFLKARAAIERQMESGDKIEANGEYRSLPDRQADAFMAIMSARIANDNDPDRANVSIHCDLGQFANLTGVVDVEGTPLMMENVAKMLCDSRIQLVKERDGVPVGIGRTSRRLLK